MSAFDVILVTFGMNFVAAAGWVAGACGGLAIGLPLIARALRKLLN